MTKHYTERTEQDAYRDAEAVVAHAKADPVPLPAGRDPKNGGDWYSRIVGFNAPDVR